MATLHLVAAGLAVLGTVAHAEPACLRSRLERRTIELLGRDPFGPALQLELEAIQARVTIVDPEGVAHGPRVVTAASCDELIEATALVIAIAVSAVAHAPAPRAPRPAHQETDDELDFSLAYAAPSLRRTPYSFGAIAAVGIEASWRQRMTVGARAARGRASLELAANVNSPEEVELAGEARIHIATMSATASPCIGVGPATVCALLTVGRLTGRGEQLVAATTRHALFGAAGGRIAWERRVAPPLGFRLSLDVEAPLATTRFLVDRMPVWSTRAVEAWLVAGIVASIP